MSNKSRFILAILIIVIASTCYLNLFQPKINNSLKNNDNNGLIDSSRPNSNGYAITSVWDYYAGGTTINEVSISADGRYIAAGIGNNVTLFDRSSNATLWNFNTESIVNSVSISADGKYIVAGNENGNVTLLDNTPSTKKTLIWTYNTSETVSSVAISADGVYTAVGTYFTPDVDGHVLLLNNTNLVTPEWSYHTLGEVRSVAITWDYETDIYYVGVGTDFDAGDNEVFLFNNTPVSKGGGGPMWSYEVGQHVGKVSMALDGFHMAAAAVTKIFMFNTSDYQDNAMWSYDIAMDIIPDLAISGDGNYIISGEYPMIGGSSNVLFFNTSSDPQDLPKKEEWGYTGIASDIVSVAISYNGYYSLVGYDNGNVALFNRTYSDSKVPEWKTDTDINAVFDLSMSSDARYFAVANENDLHLFHHNIPLPLIIIPRGDDDDDDDDAIAVSLGDYYLVFLAIGVISLIVINKRKLIFSKN